MCSKVMVMPSSMHYGSMWSILHAQLAPAPADPAPPCVAPPHPELEVCQTLHAPAMLSTLFAVCIVAKRMMLLPTAMFCTGSSSNVM
jgi:hypothetical protein